MPFVHIRIEDDDYAAMDRIAKRMFPGFPNAVDADDVIALATQMGMAAMREIWKEDDRDVTQQEK